MTTLKALRADVVTFSSDPFLEAAEKCLVYIPDAIVVIDGGHIVDVGPASEVASRLPSGVKVQHYPDAIISAGFIDTHIHYPQTEMIGAFGQQLLEWLNTYTFVAGMQWPGELNVYVLDDGGRESVRDLAADFGFHYILRPNRGYMKKAGNLQYAFTQTSGDQIVILDADFCPRQDFLQHLVPYMDDPTVGIVQSPQYFNTTEDLGWIERTAGATQELFYRWILPSRDRFDAAIGRPRVEYCINAAVEIVEHVRGGCWADVTEAIGAWRSYRNSGAADERERN